jgi:hypothetical protein
MGIVRLVGCILPEAGSIRRIGKGIEEFLPDVK